MVINSTATLSGISQQNTSDLHFNNSSNEMNLSSFNNISNVSTALLIFALPMPDEELDIEAPLLDSGHLDTSSDANSNSNTTGNSVFKN